VSKFRTKPVVIEAMQFDGSRESAQQVVDWAGVPDTMAVCLVGDNLEIDIVTLEGVMHARAGDWVIRGIKGELYPCNPDIFAATYEPGGAVLMPDPSLRSAWQIVAAYVTEQVSEARMTWGLPAAMELLADHFDTRVDEGQPPACPPTGSTAAGWKPIATAPKDGYLLLWFGGSEMPRVEIGQWDEDGIYPQTWKCDGANYRQALVTHWMPLPEPPQ
jgi:hypothetical protein